MKNVMKILEKHKRTTPLSDDVIYKLDSLSKSEDLRSLFELLTKDGYSLKKYVLNFVQDHTEFRFNLSGDNMLELFNVLNNGNITDIESIDVIMMWQEIDVYGTVYPESNVFRLSFQKKNNNVNSRKI